MTEPRDDLTWFERVTRPPSSLQDRPHGPQPSPQHHREEAIADAASAFADLCRSAQRLIDLWTRNDAHWPGERP